MEKTLKFRHNGKDFIYEIIDTMTWENKKLLTVLMEECSDNLFKWIKNNKDEGAKIYNVDLTITTINEEEEKQKTYKGCTLTELTYSRTLEAYCFIVKYETLTKIEKKYSAY